ncbi:MAG TPA: family 10 glycosylhydrolase, partial [Candidatus Binatus sp.]|nr:family 10 glycosylhydrolase [Candidatus Binatus sp.]
MAFGQETPRDLPSPFTAKRAILDGDIPLWTQKEYVDRALVRIKEAGFNVYMPTVWQGRGTAWPSKYAPWDTKLADRSKKDFDPLRYLIQRAHELGIEVHPWFTLTLRQSEIFPEFALTGMPQKAFDIHNPKFRELMVRLIEEVVTDYDVDGVNLDYVRAVGLCSSATCQEEYKE